jgi:hypothetical protein
MSRMRHRVACVACVAGALAACVAMLALAAPALAIKVPYTFDNWAVWGSLTPKKLNEPIVLPKESVFNGTGELNSEPTGVSGTVTGTITVPPFNAPVTVLGVPTSVRVRFEQIGPAQGTLVEDPKADCAGSHWSGACVTLSVNSRDQVHLTAVGILGIETPTECELTEPLSLSLSDTAPLAQQLDEGSHFTGSTDIPEVVCGGLSGVVLGPVLTELMSGPENSYDLHIGPHEPAAPTVATGEASPVSQVSAKLNATVDPNGEEEAGCEFEYGPTSSYGASVPCEWEPELNKGFLVHAWVTGLSEGATYHYRIAAANALGSSEGSDGTFTTLSGSPEYGQCVAEKHATYSDSGCEHVAEKRGVPDGKGDFEWIAGPALTCIAKKGGDYTNPACTSKSVKAHKGSYEKEPGAGFTSSSENVTLEAASLGRKVTCAASTGAGEVTGVSTSSERITFTGCASSGKKCTSEGADGTPSGSAGTIETNLLRNRLLGPALGQVWTELVSAEHEPYSAEFGCEGVRLRTKGSLAGVQRGDVGTPSLTSTATLSFEEGEQALTVEVSENSGKSWSAPAAAIVTALVKYTSASPIEIRK